LNGSKFVNPASTAKAPGKLPLVDGFLMNPAIRYLPYRFYPMGLSNLEWLRRQKDQYNPRWYSAPFDPTVPIAPTDTLYYQVEAVPDSWIYALNLSIYPGTAGTVDDIMIQILDACNGRQYWSNPVVGKACSPSVTENIWPVLLSDPIKVDNPGFLDVRVTNRVNAAPPGGNRQAQLVIHCYEPRWAVPRYQAQRLG
jgi:hypothetical protein